MQSRSFHLLGVILILLLVSARRHPLLSLATDQPAEESKGNESKSVQHTQTARVSASTGQDALWPLHPAFGLSWATCLVALVLENNTQLEALGLPPDPDPGVN